MDAHRIYSRQELTDAHKHSSLHEAEVKRSELCGCFYCTAVFPPTSIVDWIDDRNVPEQKVGATALCPKCGIDSVIGSASGYPISPEFLQAMEARWFSAGVLN